MARRVLLVMVALVFGIVSLASWAAAEQPPYNQKKKNQGSSAYAPGQQPKGQGQGSSAYAPGQQKKGGGQPSVQQPKQQPPTMGQSQGGQQSAPKMTFQTGGSNP